jgi:hypothetical protein
MPIKLAKQLLCCKRIKALRFNFSSCNIDSRLSGHYFLRHDLALEESVGNLRFKARSEPHIKVSFHVSTDFQLTTLY